MTEQLTFPETVRREAENISTKQMLMRLHLEAMVPFAIHDLAKAGGPSEQHFARARNVLAWDIAESGDALLYRVKGKTSEMMSKLIEGIAILSFCPGGIDFLGLHFEASMPGSEASL